MEHAQITAITSNKNLLYININCANSVMMEVVQALLVENILISNVTTGQNNLEITTEIFYNNRCKEILSKLKDQGAIENYSDNVLISSISIIGYGLKNHSKIAVEILSLLKLHNIIILDMEITDLRISIFTQDENVERAIQVIHEHYF